MNSLTDDSLKLDVNTGDRETKLVTKIGGGLSIAASIFVAFVFVLQNGSGGGLGLTENLQASAPIIISTDSSGSGLQNVSAVSSYTDKLNAEKQPKIIVEFTEAHARQFNEYLLRHAEHSVASSQAGMMPLARVASVNAVGI